MRTRGLSGGDDRRLTAGCGQRGVCVRRAAVLPRLGQAEDGLDWGGREKPLYARAARKRRRSRRILDRYEFRGYSTTGGRPAGRGWWRGGDTLRDQNSLGNKEVASLSTRRSFRGGGGGKALSRGARGGGGFRGTDDDKTSTNPTPAEDERTRQTTTGGGSGTDADEGRLTTGKRVLPHHVEQHPGTSGCCRLACLPD